MLPPTLVGTGRPATLSDSVPCVSSPAVEKPCPREPAQPKQPASRRVCLVNSLQLRGQESSGGGTSQIPRRPCTQICRLEGTLCGVSPVADNPLFWQLLQLDIFLMEPDPDEAVNHQLSRRKGSPFLSHKLRTRPLSVLRSLPPPHVFTPIPLPEGATRSSFPLISPFRRVYSV